MPASESASNKALTGLRVIEYGDMVSAPYTAKLMADLGADVVKVEPPQGDSSRRRGPFPPGYEGDIEASGLFLYLNSNKRGVVLDLENDSDRQRFRSLLEDADVLVQNMSIARAEQLGIDYSSLSSDLPHLVYTWITPYGLSGPRARWEGDNLTALASGGWASITPGNSTDPNLPPLAVFGSQADFQAGVHAAIATMGALFARRVGGQGQLVEVSEQEVIAAALELALVNYTYTGVVASRLGVSRMGLMGMLQCKDGLVMFIAPQEEQWQAFLKIMGSPEWAQSDLFADRVSRGENADALKLLVEEWTMERSVEEVFDLAAGARLPFAPVSMIGDLFSSPHLKARGFFATVRHPVTGEVTVPGAPYVLGKTPWELVTPAPTLGQHNEEVLPAYRRMQVT